VNVYHEYREPGTTTPAPFRGSHQILVVTRDLTGFGTLLNAAVAAAGNSLNVQSLQFDVTDKSALLTQARELAFRQAQEKGTELATLAGYSLGSVTAISETDNHAPIRGEALSMSAKAFDAGGINITPGEHSVEVSLQVHFSWA
jgi:uncharacterized protein YggE